MGNTDEPDEVTVQRVDDWSVVTVGEQNFLSLRGPLSCCTAAHVDTDVHTRDYQRVKL